MRRTVHALLLALILVAHIAAPVAHAARERDPLASVVNMEQPQLLTSPPDLFTSGQQEEITAIVNEARLFGVPLMVRAIGVPTSLDQLPQSQLIDGAAPTEQQLVQRMGEEWLATESRELIEDDITPMVSADEGILLMVIVPEDDHTRATAAFAVGDKALPLNGLTQDNLDRVLNDIIYPFFQGNSISGGIQSGIAYLSYDNLFGVPARIERSENQQKLATVTNTVLAAGTVIAVAALGGLLAWIYRRSRNDLTADGTPLSAFAAGALARGRVDDNVTTAALLHLVQRKALVPREDRGWTIDREVEVADPFAATVLDRLALEATDDGTLPDHALRRQDAIMLPARRMLENELADRGLLHRDARVELAWALIGCIVVAAMAIFLLSPAMASLSRLGVYLAGFAFLAVAGAITWIVSRPWTTERGEATLREWMSHEPSQEDAAIFDLITNQDALVRAPGGPDVPSPIRMVRQLRALGAG